MKMSSGTLRHVIAVMMEAAGTCETSVNFYQTARLDISEDIPLHHHLLLLYKYK
jgi:hypothetical protein